MAVLTITLPDEVVATYGKYDKNPATAMSAQLVRMKDHDPKGRVVILPSDVRAHLERRLGMTLDEPNRLVKWIDALLTANLGGVEVALTEGQRKRGVALADFWKQDPKAFLKTLFEQAIRQRLGV